MCQAYFYLLVTEKYLFCNLGVKTHIYLSTKEKDLLNIN